MSIQVESGLLIFTATNSGITHSISINSLELNSNKEKVWVYVRFSTHDHQMAEIPATLDEITAAINNYLQWYRI